MRDMEMERRLRAGEEGSESWKELGGFEKYTKVFFYKEVFCVSKELYPGNWKQGLEEVRLESRVWCWS